VTGPASLRSREHLLHVLAEAAELEHNLLCSYLYAAFSLKRGEDEGLTAAEVEAVSRWRTSILEVCMEEMSHLAQVANLMVALGSRPHFDRPNLPVPPGYHPAGIQVSLRPFDMDTLDHFIYLERPVDVQLEDAPPYRHHRASVRAAEVGVLMPSAPDYATIGEFYELLGGGLSSLSESLGESRLFIGPADCQLQAHEIGIEELSVVTGLASALRAIHLIIVQGEGTTSSDDSSHYRHFLKIREEFVSLRTGRPEFEPARNVACNPVMRHPADRDRVHVTAQPAAAILDAANAVYSLMLRFLVELYQMPAARADLRSALLQGATGLMGVLTQLSDALTRHPAATGGQVLAGVTFAMLRSTEGLAPGVDPLVVLEDRLAAISGRVPELELPRSTRDSVQTAIGRIHATLLAVGAAGR
jgi:hypothetical protein